MVYTAEKGENEGEFYLKGSNNKYLSLIKPAGKTFYTVDFTDDKVVAWKLDESTGALLANYDGEDRMLGTSNTKTYETIGVIKASAAASNFVIRATLVGMAEAEPDPVPADSVTVSKTMTEIVTERNLTTSANGSEVCYTSLGLDKAEDAIITFSTSGAANCGSFWGSTTKDYRLYQAKSGDLKITAKAGYKIVSVKVTYTSSNDGTLKYNSENVATNAVVNVDNTSITFVVGNTGTKTNGQARVTAIEVVYVAA